MKGGVPFYSNAPPSPRQSAKSRLSRQIASPFWWGLVGLVAKLLYSWAFVGLRARSFNDFVWSFAFVVGMIGTYWAMSVANFLISPAWNTDQQWQRFLEDAALVNIDIACIIFANVAVSRALRPINVLLALFVVVRIWLAFFGTEEGNAAILVVLFGGLLNFGCLLRLLRDLSEHPIQFGLRSLVVCVTLAAIGLAIWRAAGGSAASIVSLAFGVCVLPWGLWNAFHFYSTKPLIAALTFHLWRNFWWTMLAGISAGEHAWQVQLRGTLLLLDVPLAIGRYLFVSTDQNPFQLTEWQRDFAASIVGSVIWFAAIFFTARWLKRKRVEVTTESRSGAVV